MPIVFSALWLQNKWVSKTHIVEHFYVNLVILGLVAAVFEISCRKQTDRQTPLKHYPRNYRWHRSIGLLKRRWRILMKFGKDTGGLWKVSDFWPVILYIAEQCQYREYNRKWYTAHIAYELTEPTKTRSRWLYCLECPQYSIRLEEVRYLCTSCLLPAFDDV